MNQYCIYDLFPHLYVYVFILPHEACAVFYLSYLLFVGCHLLPLYCFIGYVFY